MLRARRIVFLAHEAPIAGSCLCLHAMSHAPEPSPDASVYSALAMEFQTLPTAVLTVLP